VPDPAVACYSTMPYELQPAPPTRPTLHECDMQCSHFRGSSFEPDLLGVGAGLQDRWGLMEQVESILPIPIVFPGRPNMPSVAHEEPQRSATDFQIQEANDFAPLPSQPLPTSPSSPQSIPSDSSEQGEGATTVINSFIVEV
jgi:hypothetical protein